MKKKILVGAAVFLGIIIIAAAAVTVWQWRNIKALYIAATTEETVIDEKLRENEEKYAEDVKGYLKDNIRDFTEEELKQIENGEKSKTEVLAKIISETMDKESSADNSGKQNVSGADSSGQSVSVPGSEGNTPKPQPPQKTETAEQIVARHVSNLYAYQSDFEGRINALAGTVKAYMHSYKAANPGISWNDAKVATVQRYMSTATSIESECYAKVDNEVAQLRAELKAIGADTSIADTVAASAENQMALKKSKIMSQYMNKMKN